MQLGYGCYPAEGEGTREVRAERRERAGVKAGTPSFLAHRLLRLVVCACWCMPFARELLLPVCCLPCTTVCMPHPAACCLH